MLQSAILGDDLAAPLQKLASTCRASGGCFIRTTKTEFLATPCLSLADAYRRFRSGQTPPDYPELILRRAPTPNFLRDYDPASARYARNAFYAEFMRPNAMARSVRIRLLASQPGYHRFSFFRDARDPPFECRELAQFDAISPFLEAAAAVCQTNFARETASRSELFQARGLPAFTLGRDGRVLAVNPLAQDVIPDLLDVAGGRLNARLGSEQKRINAAIQAAVSDPATPAMARLSAAGPFPSPMLLTLPIAGPGRDVFARAAAFAVVVDVARKTAVAPESLRLLSASLSLTGRESDVVGLVAAGQNLKDAADDLNISLGTARGHLKTAMQKAGVHSQLELAALVAKINGLLL